MIQRRDAGAEAATFEVEVDRAVDVPVGEMSPANSIEIAVWVAVGGRGTLIGPIVGAFLVNLSKSWFTQAFPQLWLFFLGLLFVIVTLALPRGVVGLVMSWRERRRGAGGQT